MTTHPSQLDTSHAPRRSNPPVSESKHQGARRASPPRQVWPLLATITTTAVMMLGTVLWHAVPALGSIIAG